MFELHCTSGGHIAVHWKMGKKQSTVFPQANENDAVGMRRHLSPLEIGPYKHMEPVSKYTVGTKHSARTALDHTAGFPGCGC